MFCGGYIPNIKLTVLETPPHTVAFTLQKTSYAAPTIFEPKVIIVNLYKYFNGNGGT
jgi:hypothetical protein